jgi:hypothetical protein
MTSPDGITWTSRTSAADNNWYSVTYGNGLFVAVSGSGTGNRVMTSPDGITWTSRTSAADNNWYSVTYGNGLFVAVSTSGTGNRVMTSSVTTYFNGASAQQIEGSLSGASAFDNVIMTGAGQKIITDSASTTNLTINTTATTTFNDALSTLETFSASAGSKIAFGAGVTTTVGSLVLSGTSGEPISFFSDTPATQANFALIGSSTVTYTTITDNNACGSTGGEIDVSGGNNIDGGNTDCWVFILPVPTIMLTENLHFYVNQATTTISAVTITENAATSSIVSVNDIRINIATTTTDFRFDTNTISLSMSGTASGKVSGTVSYEDDGATMVIDVTTDFSPSDTLIIDGIKVGSFNSVSTTTGNFALYKNGDVTGESTATSPQTIRITGSLLLSDHTLGQVSNKFSFRNETDETLFAFNLTANGEEETITDLVLTLFGIQGITTSNLSNFRLYKDNNSDGELDGGDIQIDSAGILNINGQNGAVTFSTDFIATSSADYIVIADVTSIDKGNAVVFRLSSIGITASGDISLFEPYIIDTLEIIQHHRYISGGGGSSARIDAIEVVSDGDVTGGDEDSGEEIGYIPDGENISPEIGFFNPTATGDVNNEWTNGSNALLSDGSYATATSVNLRQSYCGFSFGIPTTDTIQGIAVKLDASGSTADGTIDVSISWDGGGSYTTNKATPTLVGTDVVYAVGGLTDTWGRSWSVGDFSTVNFRLRVTAQPVSNTVKLDALEVRVFHQAGGGGAGGGGGI